MAERAAIDLEALCDLTTPWCIRVAVTLRIAEHIAGGITDVAALASAAACDRHVLHGVLAHLADKGVFAETAPGRFALTDASRQLLDPGMRIGLDLHGIGGRLAEVWSTLLDHVKTGAPAYASRFDLPFWDDLDAHPELAASFDDLIGAVGHGTPRPDFEIEGGWSSVHTVVDVGGGTGGMLAALVVRHPLLRGTLVDLPRTVARSAQTFAAAGVTDRITARSQSFFDPLPGGADVYLLKSVLSDWPDRETVAILRRCAEAARPSGRVVILSGVAPDAIRPSLSIEGILCGGKINTLGEFRELARSAGLEVTAAARQARWFVVECRPSATASRPA